MTIYFLYQSLRCLFDLNIVSAIGNGCTQDDDCTEEGFICNAGICECEYLYFQSENYSEYIVGMLQVRSNTSVTFMLRLGYDAHTI